MSSLPLYKETEEYIFVHGGVSINPDKPLYETDSDELLWNRQPVRHYSGKTIVVGHSIHNEVTFYPEANTLYIDTGAFRSGGKLSCVDLSNMIVHSIETGSDGNYQFNSKPLDLSLHNQLALM